MMLSALIPVARGARLAGADVQVSRATDDSRDVGPGDVFVAVRGRRSDGHAFVAEAARRGAAAAVVDEPVEVEGGLPQLVVPRTGEALGAIAAALAGSPAGRLESVVGVTGTNGKTTVTHLVASILEAAGRRPGVIGTIGTRYAGRTLTGSYTTPPPVILQRTLADMADAGVTDAVLEASSAALAMDRLEGTPVTVAAFTNLSQDHLDVHGDLDTYRDAKARLLSRHLRDDGTAVVDIDDPHGEGMARAAGARRVLRVSTDPASGADVCAVAAEATVAGIRAEVRTPRGTVAVESAALLGRYNVANATLAVAVGEALGLPHEAIARGIAALPGVPGRVERVDGAAGLDVFVDYAHTPDALANLLDAMRPLAARRLHCVFGCGGDRDPAKRPAMGARVAARADRAYVTSDNPRGEDPRAILADILPGMDPPPAVVEPDRRAAIAAAIFDATPGDVVVIAGKGHETYQIVGDERLAFDDREEARAAAARRPGITAGEVAAIAGGRVARGDPAARLSRVVIDGRAAAPGDLYVAIRGDRHDGHDFCDQATAAGAAGVLVETGRAPPGAPVAIETADPRAALAALARAWTRRWREAAGGRVVGVTGSAGKTTTKELVAAALAAAGPVHRSAGSHNNETGVPLTLLGLRPHHRFAVVEMGMRGLGQIAELAAIAEPDVGVVTNAGTAHVGVVGSEEAIVRGKSEIFAGVRAGGAAVYPHADARLAARAGAAPRRVSFGADPGADVRLTDYEPLGPEGARLAIEVDGRTIAVTSPLVGRHNADNAACALAAAHALGVPLERAARGLERARPPAMRSQIAEVAGRRVLVDCYNANPASVDAALAAIAELRERPGGVAVLGDMLELGDGAGEAHRRAGERAVGRGLTVVAVGDHAADVAAGAQGAGGRGDRADDPDDAARQALEATAAGDWILLKASRGVRLERVLDALRARSRDT